MELQKLFLEYQWVATSNTISWAANRSNIHWQNVKTTTLTSAYEQDHTEIEVWLEHVPTLSHPLLGWHGTVVGRQCCLFVSETRDTTPHSCKTDYISHDRTAIKTELIQYPYRMMKNNRCYITYYCILIIVVCLIDWQIQTRSSLICYFQFVCKCTIEPLGKRG